VNAHRFYKNHTDLGFPQLIRKSALRDKKSGYLVNDTLIVEFLIEVLENTTYATDGMCIYSSFMQLIIFCRDEWRLQLEDECITE
jgi:hypothetical protein